MSLLDFTCHSTCYVTYYLIYYFTCCLMTSRFLGCVFETF